MYIAKQIDPQFQDSSYYMDEEAEGLVISGNKRYASYATEDFDNIMETLLSVTPSLYSEDTDSPYETKRELIEDNLPSVDGRTYTEEEIERIYHILEKATMLSDDRYWKEEDRIIVDLLSVMSGHEWGWRYIRGSSQSDWQKVYYQKDMYTDGDLNRLATIYFNEGSEWRVYPDDNEDDVTDVYCTACDISDLKTEIASNVGVPTDKIILLLFNGYDYVPKYRKA